VVTGILTWMDGGTDACADGGRDQHAVLIDGSTLDWMERVMGDTCREYVLEHHEYARCWD